MNQLINGFSRLFSTQLPVDSLVYYAISLQTVINRVGLMKQAEKVFEEFGGSKAVLEIQYENEVNLVTL